MIVFIMKTWFNVYMIVISKMGMDWFILVGHIS